MIDAKEFVKDRNEAFIDFVNTDDMTKLNAYFKKYKIKKPISRKIIAAAIYKAVQECTDIPEDIKDKAFVKCLELGFSPFIPEHFINYSEDEVEK